jgi:hypothetical protein
VKFILALLILKTKAANPIVKTLQLVFILLKKVDIINSERGEFTSAD